jgi:hypothetical protein
MYYWSLILATFCALATSAQTESHPVVCREVGNQWQGLVTYLHRFCHDKEGWSLVVINDQAIVMLSPASGLEPSHNVLQPLVLCEAW